MIRWHRRAAELRDGSHGLAGQLQHVAVHLVPPFGFAVGAWTELALNNCHVLTFPVACQSLTRITGSNSTGGIRGQCSCFRLCLPDIIRCKDCILEEGQPDLSLFFLLRKLILPFYSFTLVCIILPMTMFVPEAELPDWVVCYIPALMSFLNILPAPKYFPFIISYLLFQNTMSVTKFNAMIYGLFQLGSAYEWVVTKKSDRSLEGDLIALAPKGLKQRKAGSTPILDAAAMKEQYTPKQSALRKEAKKKNNRTCKKGLALSLLLLAAAAAARILLSKQGIHFYFMLFQGLSFLPVGLDLIGEDVN